MEEPQLILGNKAKLEVDILDEREVVTYPKLNVKAVTVVITYRHADLPPRTIFIPKAEDTPKNRAKLIREDIEKAKAAKPKKLMV